MSDKAIMLDLDTFNKLVQANTTTLRDQFAMAALQGMISATEKDAVFPESSEAAADAYYYADAMLTARE